MKENGNLTLPFIEDWLSSIRTRKRTSQDEPRARARPRKVVHVIRVSFRELGRPPTGALRWGDPPWGWSRWATRARPRVDLLGGTAGIHRPYSQRRPWLSPPRRRQDMGQSTVGLDRQAPTRGYGSLSGAAASPGPVPSRIPPSLDQGPPHRPAQRARPKARARAREGPGSGAGPGAGAGSGPGLEPVSVAIGNVRLPLARCR